MLSTASGALPIYDLGAKICEVRKRRRPSNAQMTTDQAVSAPRFVQLIEFQTSRIDEVCALERMWREATAGTGTVCAMSISKDRDRHNRYVWMIEFLSHEYAARSDDLDETQFIAEQLLKLVDGPAVFRNLDVLDQPL
jgi:hypothetical protein